MPPIFYTISVADSFENRPLRSLPPKWTTERAQGAKVRIAAYLDSVTHTYEGAEIREHIKLCDICRAVKMQPRDVVGVIESLTGEPWRRYVAKFLMARCAELMVMNRLDTTTAIFQAGYQYKSQAYKMFRLYLGCTPGEYRKQMCS